MSKTRTIKNTVRGLAHKLGYNFYKITQQQQAAIRDFNASMAAARIQETRTPELEKLQSLKQRYSRVKLPIAMHSIWDTRGGSDDKPDIGFGGLDLSTFRGDNAYIWAYSHPDPLVARLRYFLYADAARRRDARQLMQTLGEDGAFGAVHFDYPGIGRVSRDLMDSVVELNFLHKHLGILDDEGASILDIGAGYGRMAHRTLQANPRLKAYTCVDAIPESTFVCEHYLRYRGLTDKITVIPMDELEQKLSMRSYDLAINIHSFSECTYAAIEWWLTQVRKMSVRHLLIVPNDPREFLSNEIDKTRRDYAPLLQQLGYEIIAEEALFDDPAAREVMGIQDRMFLFKLRDST